MIGAAGPVPAPARLRPSGHPLVRTVESRPPVALIAIGSFVFALVTCAALLSAMLAAPERPASAEAPIAAPAPGN